MTEYDPLCEDAAVTGLKCAVAIFVCLMLTAVPSIQLTVGNQLGLLSTGLQNIANATTRQQ